MRRLRVLSEHPHLGKPNDVLAEFEGAQAYIDAGLAEWIVTRSVVVETTVEVPVPETTVTRPTGRRAPEPPTRGVGRKEKTLAADPVPPVAGGDVAGGV